MNRSTMIWSSDCDIPISAVGTTSRNSAATMMRRRPTTSATTPVNGAISVTASVVALIVRLTRASFSWK